MESESNQNVIFLVGAGASVEAGVSTSKKITEILVNYSSYCPSENSAAIENLLRYIQVRIADHLQVRATDVNFEYILGTLVELSRTKEYPIVPLLGEGDLLVRKLEEKVSLTEIVDKLYKLLRETLFIRNPLDYLYPLTNFLELSKPLDLFTLNYDLCLETVFEDLNIPYTTGYRKGKGTFQIWDGSEFEKHKYMVRIFKLHGSINWGHYFEYPPPAAKSRATSDTIREAEKFLARYPEPVMFNPYPIGPVEPTDRSEGMVGIMNFGTRKELLYTSSQFTVLFNYFLNALQKANTCVIIGYSFQDDRINNILEEAAAARNGGFHLVIVNPSTYSIIDSNPILWKFRDLDWVTEIDMPVGDTLKDGSILAAVEASIKRKASSIETIKEIHVTAPSKPDQQKPDSEAILKKWKLLGITFDLTHFWAKLL